MRSIYNRWNRLSIRYKVMIWLASIAAMMMLAFGTFSVIQGNVVDKYAHLMEDNAVCHEAQEAFQSERRAFEAYVRENSAENLRNYELACQAARQAIAALPFDYTLIGEERYARTWNLVSGYEGYTHYRDALIAADPAGEGYTERFYEVIEMQDSLSENVLRLVQVTLEEGNQAYTAEARSLRLIPVLYVVLTLIVAAVILEIFRMLSRRVVGPMLQMAAASRQIEENDFSAPDIRVDSADEVEALSTAFNRMKHSMGQYITTLEEKNRIAVELHRQEVARLELEQNLDRTRLEMLKSQVNPHFLFNTLNMISCMARLEDAQTTDRMILSLSSLFRYNLRTKEQEVYLEQEIEALEDYIYIQQMRFDGRISYCKQLRVDPKQVRIPSFTLQPVVENAFVHGLAAKEAAGRIILRIWERDGMLTVSIADNGRGMDEAALEALRQKLRRSELTGRGIGLGNICRRITMMYPRGDFRIYSRPGRGTVIQFTIPQQK